MSTAVATRSGPPDTDTRQRVSGRGLLLELAEAMYAIGRAGTPDVVEQVESVAPAHSKVLRRVLEDIPQATIRPIVECLVQLCDQRSGFVSDDAADLCRLVCHLGVDPRSYREAARALLFLGEHIEPDSQLDGLVGRALAVLNDNGVLGRRRMLQVMRFLVGLQRRPRTVVLRSAVLHVADEQLSLADLETYDEALKHHSTLWGPKAAALALYPDTQKYGAVDLEKIHAPLTRTLTVERPARVLLPGRSAQRRWLRVDPIPQALTHPEPIQDMAPFIQLDPPGRWATPEMRSTLEVVYAGARVAFSIVQALWLSRLRLTMKIVDEPGNKSCYMPGDKAIYVWRGPMSAWSVIHEIAHAIDDVLHDGPGFASSEPRNPLHGFVTLVRPHYRDVAERRARTLWNGMLRNGTSEAMASRLRAGLVPVDDVVDSLGWLRPELRPAIRQLITDDRPPGMTQLLHAIAGSGQPLHGGELSLLQALNESHVTAPDGTDQINVELGWEPFRHAQVSYLLSDHELFARFFDQYARMYMAQLKAPFGPTTAPGFLEAGEFAALVPIFHKAMLEAQVLDLGHISRKKGRDLHHDTLFSIGIAGLMTLVGAGIIEPR